MSSHRFKGGFLKIRNWVGNLLRTRSPSPTPSSKYPSPAPSQSAHSNLISKPSAPSPHPRVSVDYPVKNVLGSASTAQASAALDPHTARSSHDAAAYPGSTSAHHIVNPAPQESSEIGVRSTVSNMVAIHINNQIQEDTELNPSKSNLLSDEGAMSGEISRSHMKLAWEGMKELLRVTYRVSDAFPPLKLAVAGVLEVIDRVEAVRDIPKQLVELQERTKQLNQILEQYKGELSGTLKDRMEGLARAFEDKKSNIGKKLDRSPVIRVIESTADRQYIARELRSLSFAIEICMMDMNMDTHKLVAELQQIAILNSLGDVSGAEFNREDRQACMGGTRVSLLGDLLAWATDANSHHVCWLNGLAGTEKTTVTESFCRILAQKEMLGASFFCSRDNEARRKVRNIIPFLAKVLAHMLPCYRQELVTVLSTHRDPMGLNLQDQYQYLIVEPLNAISGARSEPLVLSVDALDECEDQEGIEELLRVILGASLYFPLKFFLTGRPESALRQGFQVDNFGDKHKSIQLHNIERHLVEADICMYLSRKLENLKNKQQKDREDWPADEVNALIKRSGTLFIFAATAIKFLSDAKGNPTKRLRKLAMLNNDSIEATRSIDSLYELVLSEAFQVDDDEQSRVKDCLVTVVCAHTPLPISSYSVLLGIELEDVHVALAALHSVVHISNDADPTVSVYHASFPDYLTSSKRSGNQSWYFALEEGHLTLAMKCLELMNLQLDFNIVKLTTSYLSNDAQPSAPSVAPSLGYACTGWGNHLFHSTNDIITKKHTLFGGIDTFLRTKFLYWLEVLSVLKNVQYASTLLLIIDERSESLQTICKDFIEFISNFRCAIEYNAAHIYLSALAFVHQTSMVAELYHSHFQNRLVVHGRNVTVTRQQELLLFRDHTASVRSVAFSPDGKYIVSGSSDHTIRLWSVETGKAVGEPYQGHTDSVQSVAFSPDGKYIVSGSSDHTIQLWSVETGKAIGQPCQGYTYSVRSVAFSPDGKYIVSGSDDRTIQLWSVETGKAVGEPCQGHTDSVWSVAFSPDGKYIASGSDDWTIQLWSVETGKAVGEPYHGHTAAVWSVAFSPDGKYIVSGSSDHTIQLWCVETGKAIGEPYHGHTDWVRSVAFSPDGKYIVSGSHDHTIQLWSVETGKVVGEPYQGYTDLVLSVAFSPDGKYIVSGSSDHTIRLWRVETDKAVRKPYQGHTYSVRSVAFSPDGKIIVSGSSDNTVWLWSVETGEAVGEPCQGHTYSVRSVAFSPDGNYIVSGSDDHTIQLWSVETGKAVGGPYQGHTASVRSVAFSPDGQYIVSGSSDHTIQLWSVETGKAVGEPYQGHTDSVQSVAFSPDGKYIVSGSHDHTIQLWSVETGKAVGQIYQDYTSSVSSVAFSPDGKYIVSGSYDHIIQLWSVKTGKAVGEPYHGHTDWVRSVAFSPDGKYIVSGSHDHTIQLWSVETGKAVGEPYQGHTDSVWSVAFSPDGKYIVSGSSDNTIWLWSVETGKAVEEPYQGYTDSVKSMAFSPDENYIISGSDDDIICLRSIGAGKKFEEPHQGHIDIVKMSQAESQFVHYFSPGSFSFMHWDKSYAFSHGWVTSPLHTSVYLFWVPPRFRSLLWTPGTVMIFHPNSIQLDLSNFMHGDQWTRSKSVLQNGSSYYEPTGSDMPHGK
ncbi:hypothetical protein M422DRAFT_267789 [Sphaerobolus stellatus SS14]|uniref:NACHT domain-containing protein n=1 Tax=Sphaerobolus stellatus (strain SS14) TaxID=990650 RepID=A0A0C9U890_SPHS4|nr:hypothetical protein M422DRAFT_267789 [Sphaerobolus stellatus SS14]